MDIASSEVESAGVVPVIHESVTGSGLSEVVAWIRLEQIEANPYQPRRSFDEATLDELAASIRQSGIMQPVILRRKPGVLDGDSRGHVSGGVSYQLVAGERRWRAAGRAGLEHIPAIIRELGDRQVAEWAVIENLQREDLNAMDRAEAFARLIEQFDLRHEDVADRIGINRVTVTNMLRLLDLADDVQELIRLDKLSAGHGRAILGLDDPVAQTQLAKQAVAGGWSVRQIEHAVKKLDVPISQPDRPAARRSAHYADLERRITSQLKMKAHINPGRKKGTGTLSIEFQGLDAFDALMQRLGIELE